MPILRLNAHRHGLSLHGSPAPALPTLRRAALGRGPVMILIHGFKYDPSDPSCSPHTTIFGSRAKMRGAWLAPLGFGQNRSDEGLAIAFGWRARGNLGRARQTARAAGVHLARVIRTLRAAHPARPIHVITHSMGSEVVLEALHALCPGDLSRVVTLSAASYASCAAAAFQTPAGRAAELLNITSRENDVFDFLFERLTPPPVPGDQAMGVGVDLPNAVNIQLDCPDTLRALLGFGGHIAPPQRRLCHWSSYTRSGALRFYAHALRAPHAVPLVALRAALPAAPAARWSRMFARAPGASPLPPGQKAAT